MAGWELSELGNRYLDARTLRNDGRRKLRKNACRRPRP